jgi:glycosyltransferase involved in cell wall biosynthesis
MNTPSDDEVGIETKGLRETTHYLDGVSAARKLAAFILQSVSHPIRLLACLREFVTASPMHFPRDQARLAYHLLEGGYLAWRYRNSGIQHIHAHLINGPTSLAMFTSMMLGISFSFTMHASMIWLDPIAFRNKLRRCKFCVSISDYNRRYVLEQYGSEHAGKIHVIHCGLDPEHEPEPRGGESGGALSIVGVGQLNPRKGFHVLIPACGILRDRGVEFRCTIVGEGAQRAELERLIEEHGLGNSVTLTGALPHARIDAVLGQADMFVLPCVISKDGWRDGIPVALMEAMFAELPVISTSILGLPELIDDAVSGLLVPPEDPARLAEAIAALRDGEMRRKLGENGRVKILREFNNDKSARSLAALFDAS